MYNEHVMRREEDYVDRKVMELGLDGRRGRERPKRRWMENVMRDLKEKNLQGNEWRDRAERRRLVRNADPA